MIIRGTYPKMATALSVLIATMTLRMKVTLPPRAVNVMTRKEKMHPSGWMFCTLSAKTAMMKVAVGR